MTVSKLFVKKEGRMGPYGVKITIYRTSVDTYLYTNNLENTCIEVKEY